MMTYVFSRTPEYRHVLISFYYNVLAIKIACITSATPPNYFHTKYHTNQFLFSYNITYRFGVKMDDQQRMNTHSHLQYYYVWIRRYN